MGRSRSIVGDRPEGRPELDFYPTPPEATKALLPHIDYWKGPIWEPACGDGAISRVLKKWYQDRVIISTDLHDYGYGKSGVDFLQETWRPGNCKIIVTNPPYKLATQFITHALEIGCTKIAMLMKLAALEGQERSQILEASPLLKVLVFRKRLTMTRNGDYYKNSGMIAFAWYLWDTDKPHGLPPMIGWL